MEKNKRKYDVYIQYDGEGLTYDDTVEASLEEMTELTRGIKKAYKLADVVAFEKED